MVILHSIAPDAIINANEEFHAIVLLPSLPNDRIQGTLHGNTVILIASHSPWFESKNATEQGTVAFVTGPIHASQPLYIRRHRPEWWYLFSEFLWQTGRRFLCVQLTSPANSVEHIEIWQTLYHDLPIYVWFRWCYRNYNFYYLSKSAFLPCQTSPFPGPSRSWSQLNESCPS